MSRQLAALVYSRRVGDLAEKAVLAFCAEKASNDGTGIWPSKNTIAGALDCGKSTVIRAFHRLLEKDLLVVTGQRRCATGATNVYSINIPAIEALPKVKADPEDEPKGCQSDTGSNVIPVPLRHAPGVTLTPKPSMNRPLEGGEEMRDAQSDDLSEAVAIFNEVAARTGWAKVQKLTDARKARLRARLKDAGGLDGWREAMTKAEASAFLTGQTNGFRPGLDFFLQESSFVKLMEGNYDNRSGLGGPARGNVALFPTAARGGAPTSLAGIVAQSRLKRQE